ncbi:hypothetical protein QJQ45_013321 [Haematococcus lacustris]|nr:hypothetical protein QJQ45_013321 [Haematococcus lacustris]
MDAACKGAKAAGGTTIGIIPGDSGEDVSDAVDILIITGLGSARNNINVLSCAVVVAVGMGPGTASEYDVQVALALKAKKHVVLLGRLQQQASRLQLQASTTWRLQLQASSTWRLQQQASTTWRLQLQASSTWRLQQQASSTSRLELKASSTSRLELQASSTWRLQLQPREHASNTCRLVPPLNHPVKEGFLIVVEELRIKANIPT